MTRSAPLVRVLGLSLLCGFGALSMAHSFGLPSAPVEEVKEPESGVRYQTVLKGAQPSKGLLHPTSGKAVRIPDLTLTGVGIREKTIFAVNVYAMGIYVDSSAAAKKLSKWRGKTHKELRSDDSFYAELLKRGYPTTLRLVMCRDVDGDDMAEAFDDSLKPRMKAILAKDAKLGHMQHLKRFRSFFDVDEVKDDVELLFTWSKDGVLYTRMDGKFLGAIASPALCQSLFDVYLGRKPITKSGKRSLVARLPQIIAAGASRK